MYFLYCFVFSICGMSVTHFYVHCHNISMNSLYTIDTFWEISSLWKLHGNLSTTYVGWLIVLRIKVDLAIFQPYLDLEAGDNQSLKIQVAGPEIKPRSSCSASQELNHSATTAPNYLCTIKITSQMCGLNSLNLFLHLYHFVVRNCSISKYIGLALLKLKISIDCYLVLHKYVC